MNPSEEDATGAPIDPPAGPAETTPLTPEARAAAERAALRSAPGQPTIPGFDVLGELGRGAMGVVYKARHLKLNRIVALKMILGPVGERSPELARFWAEAEAMAAVRHPHVAQVFEVSEVQGQPCLVMEHLSGGTLAQRLAAGPLDPRTAAAVVSKVARGVQAAHDQQIVHRDLKPGNILFDEHGEPKVTDFGLAKRAAGADLTSTGAVMGTPAYMAPEQASGKTKFVGPAADIYALGVILYQCLTGRRPFADENPVVLLRKVIEDDPVPPRECNPAVPRDLELICLQCLRKDPAARYAGAKDLAADLRRFLRGEPPSARPASEWELARQWARKRWTVFRLVVGLGAVLFMTSIISLAAIQTFGVAPQQPSESPSPDTTAPPRPLGAVVSGLLLFCLGLSAWVGTIALFIRPRRWVLATFSAPVVLCGAGLFLLDGLEGGELATLAGVFGVTFGLLLGAPSRLVAWWQHSDTTDVLIGAFLGSFSGACCVGAPMAGIAANYPGESMQALSMVVNLGGMVLFSAAGGFVAARISPTRRTWLALGEARRQSERP